MRNKKTGFYIFCDESLKKGKYYSNFYGGVLIPKNEFEQVNNALLSKVRDLGIENTELKWGNINTLKLGQYVQVMDMFFGLIKANIIKVRIMFTDNRFVANNLTHEHYRNEYHILYYHFLKHAFGLNSIITDTEIDLEIFFDKLPDSEAKNEKFKNFIYGIQFLPRFIDTNIKIKKDSIYEVDSKKHILMQCLDVVLGAMSFRLNDMHKEIPPGQKRRGKRTMAKEKLYKHINANIRSIRPNFNIGITTGIDNEPGNKFHHPYRHWMFIPSSNSLAEDEY